MDNTDLTKSISDLITEMIPEDYRLYYSYGLTESHGLRRSFRITLSRGSYCCNDPCYFILCCYNMEIFKPFCCFGSDDDCPCCDCYCCCGH